VEDNMESLREENKRLKKELKKATKYPTEPAEFEVYLYKVDDDNKSVLPDLKVFIENSISMGDNCYYKAVITIGDSLHISIDALGSIMNNKGKEKTITFQKALQIISDRSGTVYIVHDAHEKVNPVCGRMVESWENGVITYL
jgi:hypothetical protein